MGASIHINNALKAKGKSKVQFAKENNFNYQSFKNKLSRNCMRFNEVEEMADRLDCDVVFIDRITHEIY